jgi:hypothetical protein
VLVDQATQFERPRRGKRKLCGERDAVALIARLVRAVQCVRPMIRAALLATLFLLACATAPRSERAAQPRLKDSVPEKIAAQRAASGNLQLQAEEDRWGFEGQAERNRDRGKPASTVVVPLPTTSKPASPDAGMP